MKPGETDDNAMKPKITCHENDDNVLIPPEPNPPTFHVASTSDSKYKRMSTCPPHLSRSINFKNRSSHTFGFTPVGS